MRFRSMLNTHKPDSDTLFSMRDGNARERESVGAKGARILQAEEKEALVRRIHGSAASPAH